jgi:autotransporter-associated beta strand protein
MYNPIQLTDTISTVRASLRPSPWRRRGILCSLAAGPTLVFLLLAAATAFAGSATWDLNPTDGVWNTATNWTPPTVPNGPADTATFGVSNRTDIENNSTDDIEVNGIVFNAGASAFTIAFGNASFFHAFTISGVGIMNSSGITQNFVIEDFGNAATMIFKNSATAGDQTVFTTLGSNFTQFHDTSTAGNATLIADSGGFGAFILFSGDSTGGTSRVEVFGNGNLDISAHNARGVAVGSIEGDGLISLGANNLTVGSNNLRTTFSGVIQDGGLAGGAGGSLTKIGGGGNLTLSGANTYTGGTTITAGTLFVTNRRGSATGSDTVRVNAGKLGGTGKISGNVFVGDGSAPEAFITPGTTATFPATVIIQRKLTLRADGTFHFGFKSSNVTADKIVARGVTIGSGALIFFDHVDTGTFPFGTVFTAIDNTAATPIAGTFDNLADGATFTIDSITFQADYQGGDGNDFSLTVVP